MGKSVASKFPHTRLRRNKRLRGLAAAAAAYLLCWITTWAFAPAAVEREFAAHYADGEFRTRCTFTSDGTVPSSVLATSGGGLGFGPVSPPDSPRWCCVGVPSCPAPLLVTVDFAFLSGPLAAGAGNVTLIWTPWGLYEVRHKYAWSS